MIFENKLVPISVFIPRVKIHIEEIDDGLVEAFLSDAIIKFLRDTKIFTDTFCIPLDACKNSYKIISAFPIIEVQSVIFHSNGTRINADKILYRIYENTLYVENLPPFVENLTADVKVVLTIPRDSDEVPEFLFEEWLEPILALTLSKLYLITDNEWYNRPAAETQMSLYERYIKQVNFSKITKYKPLHITLSNKRR